MSPFNSQNTFLAGNGLKDYFLYPHVGRMDDIWAAYYVQAKGYSVVFGKASVYQEAQRSRPCQRHEAGISRLRKQPQLVQSLAAAILNRSLAYLPGRATWAFQLYQRHFEHA